VINVGIDLLRPDILFAQHVRAPRAHTQRERNLIFSPKADIYLAFRLQLVIKFVVISLIYSSALPICYLFTSFFMWIAMWIDRYNLLRRLAPPPRSPDALIGLVLRVILPAAIALHLACAVMFYSYELDTMQGDPLCPEGGVAARSQTAICQTPQSLWQASSAVNICWLSLVVWGSTLAYYIYHEARRKIDTGVHLVDDDFVAKFVDVFTVQQTVQKQVLHETSSNPFRRDNGATLYTPPLPQWILASLRSSDWASASGSPVHRAIPVWDLDLDRGLPRKASSTVMY